MNFWDIAILVVLVLAIAAAVFHAVRRRGRCSCCDGNCACCKKKS